MVATKAVIQSAHVGMMVMVIAVTLLIRPLLNMVPFRPATLRNRPAAVEAPATAAAGSQPAAGSNPTGDYQLNWPGEVGELEQWIAVESGSRWSNTELRIVHNAIRDTIAALDNVGLDGHDLLAGYRFQRFDDRFLADGVRRHAKVNHESHLIILADRAMIAHQGFFIYHELGHVIDQRLGRRLSAMFQGQALRPATPNGLAAPADGYWLRDQGRDNVSEAAADAFALWVLVEYAGNPMPEFPTMPETVNPPVIFELVRAGLR